MKTSKELFDEKKKEIESSYDAFNQFYEKMDMLFKEREFSQLELSIVSQIKDIVDTLDNGPRNPSWKEGDDIKNKYLGYQKWDGDSLTRSDAKLATLMFNLGELASEKVQKANTMNRWVKWRKVNEWNPAKEALENKLIQAENNKKRVFKEDIETEVGKKLFAENIIEVMMSGHADLLTNMFNATRSVLTALAHRIGMKRDERQFTRGNRQ